MKKVDFKSWAEYMMFRSDGVPAAHPTFSLVVLNHKIKTQLQTQGQYVLNVSGLDPNMPVEELIKNWDDPKSGRRDLFSRLNHYSSNVVGTDFYWNSQ